MNGTYTPELTAHNSQPQGVVYDNQQGNYILSDDGSYVTVNVLISLKSKGTGGQGHAHITLPFPIGSANNPPSQGAVRLGNVTFPPGYTFATVHAYQGRQDVCITRSGSGRHSGTAYYSELADNSVINFTVGYFL